MLRTIDFAAEQPVRPVRRGWIGRHPLLAFFAWFGTVGQAFAFAPLFLDTGIPRQFFIIGSTLFGLLLPSLVITRWVDGPEGLRRMLRSYVHWRVPLRWYALALLAAPAAGLGIAALLFGSPVDWTTAVLSGFLLQLVLNLIPNNWAEEGVWTGFVQARLQERRGPVLAAVITGPLFALQHVSLTVGNPPVIAIMLMTGLMIVAIPYRFLTGLMWNRTGSLFLLGLLHAAGNALAPGSGFGGGSGGGSLLKDLYPGQGDAIGALHLLAFLAIGLIVVAVTKGRLGRSTAR